MPEFILPSSTGQPIRIGGYRGRRNLVVAFLSTADSPMSSHFVSEISKSYMTFLEEETEVVVVVQASVGDAEKFRREHNLRFSVLADLDGQVHRSFCIQASHGGFAPAVYVTDRYGEVYSACLTDEEHPLPEAEAILNWVRFIELQCPE
jgi:peroxiredoxin Q/BCP